MSIPIEKRRIAQRGPQRSHNGLEYKKPHAAEGVNFKEKKPKKKKGKPKKPIHETKEVETYTSSGLAIDGSLLMEDFGDGTGMGFDGKLHLTM